MYGGLDVAEAIRHGTLDALRDSEHRPHIAQRGINFNIPLHVRTPSSTDCSDAAQANIPEVWEREFWTRYLDTMARHRFNVLSLWSLNPFPSLVKVSEFPEVALDDVWRTRTKLDDTWRRPTTHHRSRRPDDGGGHLWRQPLARPRHRVGPVRAR